MKRCTWCKAEKPLSEFYNAPRGRKGYPDGKMAHCRECHKAQCARNVVKKRYGLTMEEYTSILAKGCALCQTQNVRIVMDHDHRNGKVRAALCDNCNRGLGSFHDDPERMRRAAAYIEEWRASHA